MKQIQIFLACMIFLSAMPTVYAEDKEKDHPEEEEEVWVLEEISVTGLRIDRRLKDSPVATEVIDKEEIERSGASDLSDVLESHGLMFTENAMGDYITLQGMGGGRVLFLIDGRRIPGRVAQRIQGDTLPIGNVERVEIVRGAQSALYGSDGIGGVVNVITSKPENYFSFNARVANSSLPTYRNPESSSNPGFFETTSPFQEQILTGNITFGIGSLSSRITLDGKKSWLYLDENRSGSILPSQMRGKGGIEVEFPIGDRNYIGIGGSLLAMRTDDQTNAEGGLFRQDVTRYEGHMDSEHFIGERLTLKTQFYNHYYTRSRRTYLGLSKKWEEPENEAENILAGDIFATIDAATWLFLTAGFEGSYNTLWREWLVLEDADGTVSRDREAIVLQSEFYKETVFSIVLGVRGERDSLFGYMASPRLAGMVYLTPSFRLLSGLGVGYRAPDFNELYLYRDPAASMPFVVKGNPDLKPEYSFGGNLGAEYAAEKFFVNLSVYYTELFQEIEYSDTGDIDPVSSKPIIETENINRSLRTGVDLEGRLTFLKRGFISGGYGFLYAYDRTNGERMRSEPAHTARLKIGIDNPDTGLYFHVSGIYYSPEDPDSDTQSYSEHRYKIDLYGSYKFHKHFLGFASVENLTGYVNRSLGPFFGPKLTIGCKTTF